MQSAKSLIRGKSRFSIHVPVKPLTRSLSGWPANMARVSSFWSRPAMCWSRKRPARVGPNAFPRKRFAGFSRKLRRPDFSSGQRAFSGCAGQDRMRSRESFPPRTLLAGGEDAGEDTIKLFDRKVLADVAIGSSAQRGVHPLFVVSDACE